MNTNEQAQELQVDINFLKAIGDYLKNKPFDEVHRFLNVIISKIEAATPSESAVFIPMDVAFLQAMLNYLKTKPYEEVFLFIETLTGRNQGQPNQMPTTPQNNNPPVNITEVLPDGYQAEQSNVK